jgi:predicted metalloprotease with PDZ domain
MRFGPAGLVCALLLSAAPVHSQTLAQAPVRYEIQFPNATHHEAEVRATFSGVTQPILEVVMSRSSPGRYALHEFAKNIYDVHAVDGSGKPLQISRPSPYQWNVSGHTGTVVFTYTLFGDRVDGTYDSIDLSHAHLNMPATFAWAHGFERRPIELRIETPKDSGWTVATQLKRSAENYWTAPNLDMMMDSPVEIGPHQIYKWDGGGRHFQIALHSQATPEVAARFARSSEAITLEAAGVFGSFPQYDNDVYTFLVDDVPSASSDGMEHRDSTIISTNRALTKESSLNLLSSVAHEFFHSWNVERIRPRSLEPFDFERVNISGELWFAEGFTNYYGPLVETRAGVLPNEEFISGLGNTLNTVLTSPGRDYFDVIDMSRQAGFVDGGLAEDPVNRINTYISYYTFGEALALGIDLEIRERFPGKSLDDWMRAMWRAHPDVNKPYTLDDLQIALAQATGNREFAANIFTRYIQGQESMDFAPLLARAGLLLRKNGNGRIWLDTQGLIFSQQGIDVTTDTRRGSPLYKAGIDRGDRLVMADGKDLKSRADLDKLIGSRKPGDRTTFTVAGRAGMREVDVAWSENPSLEIVSFERAGMTATPEQKSFRNDWLRSRAIGPLPRVE